MVKVAVCIWKYLLRATRLSSGDVNKRKRLDDNVVYNRTVPGNLLSLCVPQNVKALPSGEACDVSMGGSVWFSTPASSTIRDQRSEWRRNVFTNTSDCATLVRDIDVCIFLGTNGGYLRVVCVNWNEAERDQLEQ